MAVTLSLSEAQILTALRAFLLNVLPAGVEVVRAQVNRVPQVAAQNFVVMTSVLRARLSTNRDTYADAALTGSIAGATLTVTAVEYGEVKVGAPIYGADVTAGTAVTAFLAGAGGVGTYIVTPAQTRSSRALFAGTGTALQATQVTYQLDVHGPAGADNAQIISTLLRDEYGVRFFRDTGLAVEPLYASEPRQMPFLNGEKQIEDRWVIDAVLQANPLVQTPQQFAAEVDIELHNLP